MLSSSDGQIASHLFPSLAWAGGVRTAKGGALMSAHLAGAIISGIIILGGVIAVFYNLERFFIDELRGHRGKSFFERPFLWRAIASAFTLFWLFAPYSQIGLDDSQRRLLAFALFMIMAAAWLWLVAVGYLAGLSPQQRQVGPAWAHGLGWSGHLALSYLLQLVCAAALGYLYVQFSNTQLLWILLVPFLIGTIGVSSWRMALLTPNHTLAQRMQHVLGGHDPVPPHSS
jgi:hypothetical protein